MRAAGSAARMRRVASRPSSSGMRMSIRTTVGIEARGLAGRPRARCRLRDDLDVGLARAACGSRRGPSTGRRRRGRGWSCAGLPSGRRVVSTKPPPLARTGGHRAAVEVHALADAHEPMAGDPSCMARPAVVAYLDARARRPRSRPDVRVAGVRVLERVGEPLLNDPVGGEVERAREAATGSPSRCTRTGRPARPTLPRAASRLSSPGWGASSSLVAVVAHRAEQAAHLRERRAAGLLDAPNASLSPSSVSGSGAGPRRPGAPSRSPRGRRCRAARARSGRAPRRPRSARRSRARARPRARAPPASA